MSADQSLPLSWVECTLGDVVNYGATQKAEPSEIPNDAWVLELEDIEKDSSRVLQRLSFAERQSKSTKSRFGQGDILYGKLRPYLNKVVRASEAGYCSTEIVPLTPPKDLDGNYLFHWLKHPRFLGYVSSVSHGLNMPRLGTDAGRAAPFVLAPFPEQKLIADKLDALLGRVDACSERLDRFPNLLKRFRQSVLAAATGGELTREWRDERGLSFNWSQSTLGSVGSVTGGITKNARRANASLMRRYLRVANVYANRLILDDVAEIATTPEEFARTRLLPGDVLIVEGNGSIEQIGRAALWRGELDECAHQNHLIRWRFRGPVIPEFALYWLLSPAGRGSLVEVAKSSAGLHTLSLSKVAAVPMLVPSLDEQKEVARRVDELFQMLERLERKLANAKALIARATPSALAKAFRGELVPQNPNDVPAAAILATLKKKRFIAAAGRTTKSIKTKRKQTYMSGVGKDAVRTAILNLKSETFSFDDLMAEVSGDYECLKAALFELLEEPKPIIRQVFNKKVEAIQFERVTS